MSIDGQQSICQMLGHLWGGVVPATRASAESSGSEV